MRSSSKLDRMTPFLHNWGFFDNDNPAPLLLKRNGRNPGLAMFVVVKMGLPIVAATTGLPLLELLIV